MKWWYENEERDMNFDKSRVYTALNADELRAGDKVIVANTMMTLKGTVLANDKTRAVELNAINTADNPYRFKAQGSQYSLAYLVERAENCTNCGSTCGYADENHHALQCSRCDNWQPKTTEKHLIEKEINMNWNYEGLPTKQEIGTSDRVVVAVRGYNTVDIGYYDYELEAWFVDGNRYPVPVYAWMAIKPPKEEA